MQLTKGHMTLRQLPPPSPPYRRVAVFTLGLIGTCLLLALYAFDASRNLNALELPLQRSLVLRQLLPQGWAFFTRDPQEKRLAVYAETAQGWVTATPGSHASWAYALGFNRRSRVHGVEVALLLASLRRVPWHACEQQPTICLTALKEVHTVANPSPRPAFCGTIGIVRQEPIPWAWARSATPITMPSDILKVDVQC
jgi:antimicrobial peptide system SdpA family protein